MMLVQCASCSVERRFKVDEHGHFIKDPDRADIVTLCPGDSP
jgi:hypothetical protein